MIPLQDLLDTETVMARLGFPVDAAAYSAAIEGLRSAGTADEVCSAWNAIAGSIGPTLTAEILSCDDWRLIARLTRPLDDVDSDDQSQAVWVDETVKVIGRAELDGGQLVAVRFFVEPR